ncbi:MAG: ribosome assembly cofactor RimP [Bacteroidales bacterium]|nr:ribosome assembly cofactor RimP [Bacteroidales bacterium]
MIDKIKVLEIVSEALEGTDKYLISLKITPDNRIYVDLDGDSGINIDDCIEVSRKVENTLNRDEEDFELNVSSAGADAPLKLPRQYRRHVGRELEVVTFGDESYQGTLTQCDNESFVIQTKGTKKVAPQVLTFNYADVKTAKIVLKF